MWSNQKIEFRPEINENYPWRASAVWTPSGSPDHASIISAGLRTLEEAELFLEPSCDA
jgi:hypothetical protein